MRDHERLEKLAAELQRHDEAYYRQSAPTISDAEYDLLRQAYDDLADAAGLSEDERYTASFGDDSTNGFAKVTHRALMLSLEKLTAHRKSSGDATIREQLASWHSGLRTTLDLESAALVVEPKIDGISASLLYRDGQLVVAATRGDGKTGDNITAQVLASGCVPAQRAANRRRP